VSLEVELAARRGRFSLDASFSAGPGVTALFGRSGAGKTTIVSMVAGLARPDAGRIVLNGRTLLDTRAGIDVRPGQRRVGFVFQEARLFPHLSVRSNLLYARWAGRRRSTTALPTVTELLGIEHLLDRRPATLSGGEAQRVAIGRALMAGPELLLMDEPLSQLDGARRAEILPFLERLAHEGGVPILYVSHAVDEVARLANAMVVISDGRAIASGPIEDVFGRIDLGPATGRYEAGALLTLTVVAHEPEFALTRLSAGGDEFAVPAVARGVGETVRVRVRARDVAIALEPPRASSIRNAIRAEVAAVESEEGFYAEVLLRVCGQHLRARISRKSAAELGLEPGQHVYALIKSVAVQTEGAPQRR
jgi:molybdate transport system ATP-binding protein